MLRETGNLVFHASLLGVLLAIAAGTTLGYHGQVIVREHSGFSNVIAQYDSFGSGRWFQTSSMQPFTVTLSDMKVAYQETGAQAGSASDVAVRHVAERLAKRFGAAIGEGALKFREALDRCVRAHALIARDRSRLGAGCPTDR